MSGWHRSELLFAWTTMTGIPMTVKSNILTNTTKATTLPITRLKGMIMSFDWKNPENDFEPAFLFFIFLVLLSLPLRIRMAKRVQLKDRQTVVRSLLRIDRTVGWMRVGGFLLQNIANVANENERIVNSETVKFYLALKQRGVLNNWKGNTWDRDHFFPMTNDFLSQAICFSATRSKLSLLELKRCCDAVVGVRLANGEQYFQIPTSQAFIFQSSRKSFFQHSE